MSNPQMANVESVELPTHSLQNRDNKKAWNGTRYLFNGRPLRLIFVHFCPAHVCSARVSAHRRVSTFQAHAGETREVEISYVPLRRLVMESSEGPDKS